MTSRQLRFGAYWDALPPFYTAQKILTAPTSTYQAFTNTEGLCPLEMPRDLVFKILWQVRSVTLKLEYEFDLEQTDEWEPINSIGTSTDQLLVLTTKGPYTLIDDQYGIIASPAWETRELKLPQGYLTIGTEAYSGNADTARALTREGFGILNPFVPSDYADFETDIVEVQAAIDAEADIVNAKILEMKALATAAGYSLLQAELERQETAFDYGVETLKSTYETRINTLTAQFQEFPATEESKIFYGKKAQQLKDQATFDVKQEARLQWFEWEQGFKQRLGFREVAALRILGPTAMHRPPALGGLFAGVYQTTNQLAAASSQCMAVLKMPFLGAETEIFLRKPFSYTVKAFAEGIDLEPRDVLIESALVVFVVADLLQIISTTAERAAAVKLKTLGNATLFAGVYQSQSIPPATYSSYVSYDSLFNEFNQTQLGSPPSFPTEANFPEPEIADIVLSGPYFEGGSWQAAVAELQPIAAKIAQLKEVGEATEKGTFELRDKEDKLLFSTPLFLKTGVPLKNIKLTYKIHKLYTDPPDEEPPAGETGSA